MDVPDKTVETKAADPNKLTRIILIVGIVVPALVIVLLLFKPSKKGRYDYDRNSTMNDYGASPYDRPRSRYRDDYDDGRRRDDYRRDRRPDAADSTLLFFYSSITTNSSMCSST